jgi:hypothetical protein
LRPQAAADRISSSLQGQAAADLDEVVGDNAKADPALHTFEPSISAAIQSVAPLQHANAAFASDPPTRFLQFSSLPNPAKSLAGATLSAPLSLHKR